MRYIIRYPQEPQIQIPEIYRDALKQPHLLIGGETGSGKSVLLNGIIRAALLQSPADVGLILIDPKRVELYDYIKFPHCIQYASEPDNMPGALQTAMNIINNRFALMQKQRRKTYDGGDVYVIIDELADLMSISAKTAAPILTRIGQIGRAAKVHLIVCTQHLLSTGANGVGGIPTQIKVNLTAAIGLHTRNARDSQMIIGRAGCEKLPQYGYCIYNAPGHDAELINIPYIDEATAAQEVTRLFKWWTNAENYHPDETDPEFIKQQRRKEAQAKHRAAMERQQKQLEEQRAKEKAEFEYWQSMPMWKRILKGYYG